MSEPKTTIDLPFTPKEFVERSVQDFTQRHPSRKPPRVRGVGRMADEPRAFLVLLTEIPTDDELRGFDNYVHEWNGK